MKKRIRAFFSSHAWKLSFSMQKFFLYWISIFSIIWTFTEFTVYFFKIENVQLKGATVWIIIVAGLLIAFWMGRPRLSRTVKLKDRDITLRIVVDDIFNRKGSTVIIPCNSLFKHDHMDEGSIQVQYRNKFYMNSLAYDEELHDKLKNEPYSIITDSHQQVKQYPIGTVVRLETPTKKIKAAYLVATAELNEHGRATPNPIHLEDSLTSLWENIAQKGRKEPLVIPIIGSGRHRLNMNRFELIHEIVQSFMKEIKNCKFTEELTIVIHPDAYLRNQYSLDEMEEYLRYVSLFEVKE